MKQLLFVVLVATCFLTPSFAFADCHPEQNPLLYGFKQNNETLSCLIEKIVLHTFVNSNATLEATQSNVYQLFLFSQEIISSLSGIMWSEQNLYAFLEEWKALKQSNNITESLLTFKQMNIIKHSLGSCCSWVVRLWDSDCVTFSQMVRHQYRGFGFAKSAVVQEYLMKELDKEELQVEREE